MYGQATPAYNEEFFKGGREGGRENERTPLHIPAVSNSVLHTPPTVFARAPSSEPIGGGATVCIPGDCGRLVMSGRGGLYTPWSVLRQGKNL